MQTIKPILLVTLIIKSRNKIQIEYYAYLAININLIIFEIGISKRIKFDLHEISVVFIRIAIELELNYCFTLVFSFLCHLLLLRIIF